MMKMYMRCSYDVIVRHTHMFVVKNVERNRELVITYLRYGSLTKAEAIGEKR